MSGRVILRADGGAGIGGGHLMRCRALGLALADAGASVCVATRDPHGPLAVLIEQSGLAVAGVAAQSADAEAHALRDLGAGPGAWIVVDGYHFDASYLSALRGTGSAVAVIEDEPRFATYDIDLLLDQNLGALRRSYAAGDARLLLGPRFVMLRPEVKHATAPHALAAASRVFVTVGAAGGGALVDRLLTALRRLPGITVTVALGAFSPDADALVLEHRAPNISFLRGVADLTGAMRDADIAVATLGIAIWELAALGVPTLVVGTTPLHLGLGQAIDGYGAHRWVGDAAALDEAALGSAVSTLLEDEPARREMSRLGRCLVDGHGAARVAGALLQTEPGSWEVRPAREDDAEPVWELASDPDVRKASHNPAVFPFVVHERWFAAKLASDASCLWVAERDGTVGGFIRYDRGDGVATVSLAVAAAARGRGLATRMLDETWGASCATLGAGTARGYVFEDNIPSLRAFEKAAFRRAGTEMVGGRACVVFERSMLSLERK